MKVTLFLALVLVPCSWLHSAEVQLKTTSGILHGTLEVTNDRKKSRVVLIIPGSGPTDRDGNTAGLPGRNNSLKYLAESLLQSGTPSLRIDKRGIGKSFGAAPQERDLRFESYVYDVIEWIRHLRAEGYGQVFVLGHSEGALVGLLAAQQEGVDGYISVAGTARPASKLILEQLRSKLPADLLTQAESILDQLDKGHQVRDTPAALNALFRSSVQPYLISWTKYDPAQEIAKVASPVLIIQGSTDIQVSISDAEMLHKHKLGSELSLIEGMNHVLKSVGPDLQEQVASYSDPKLPLHEKITTAISDFIEKNQKSVQSSTAPTFDGPTPSK